MKYIVMAVLLMAGVATHAQEPVRKRAELQRVEKLTPEQKAKKLTAELGLTADQEAKVKGLYEGQEKLSNDMKEKYAGSDKKEDRQARMQQIKDAREQFNVQMKEILTPDQYTKWQSSRQHPLARGLKAGATQDVKTKPATLAPGN